MDARIVYCADEAYLTELEKLRKQVRNHLAAPFEKADVEKAEKALKEAMYCYAAAMTAEKLSDVRRQAGNVVYCAENAVAMLNKTYFRKGVKRRYEELEAMERRPEDLCGLIESIVTATTVNGLKDGLTALVRELKTCFEREKQSFRTAKKAPDAEALKGTFEEMFSNWHGKMYLAADTGNRYLAYMSLCSLNEMLSEIADGVDIAAYDVLSVYDPEDLRKTAEEFDALLRDYLGEYRKAGWQEKRFRDIDAFAADYLSSIGEEAQP